MLHYNQLKELPESIGNLINLTELTLNNNRLNELPESIGSLTNLTELALFQSQPDEPSANNNSFVVNVRDLYLFRTPFTSLPATIRLLPIRTLPRNIFIPPLYWHPKYHLRFPRHFRRMVFAFMVCNRRELLSYLPMEMMWCIPGIPGLSDPPGFGVTHGCVHERFERSGTPSVS